MVIMVKRAGKEMVVSQDNRMIQNIERDPTISPKDKRTFAQKSFMLDQYQKGLVLLLISHIKPDDQIFETENISFNDYCTLMNISKGGRTQRLIEMSIFDLASKTFAIRDEDGCTIHHWVESGARVDWKHKTIQIKLAESLRPYFVELRKNFTCYQLGFVANFKSKYGFRVYEYLKSYSGQKNIVVPVDKAFTIFCDNQYERYTDLIRRVIDPSIEEINEKSDIIVKYKRIKSGNKTTHLGFTVKEKSEKDKNAIREEWGEKISSLQLINSNMEDCGSLSESVESEDIL